MPTNLADLTARLERIELQMERLLLVLEPLEAVPRENMQHAMGLLRRATEPELRDTFEQLLGNLPPLATALLALPSDEATLDFLIRATQTFSQIIQGGPPRVGWFSAWRATREVNVQAAIGLALSFARGIGECLEQPIKQLPTYTRRLKRA